MLSIKPQIAKTIKAKEFTYIPRYYDERKEKIAEIEKAIRQKEENEENGTKKIREFHFRNSMNNRWRGEVYNSTARKSNLVIVTIVCALVMITYYLLKYTDTYTLLFFEG